jgi:alcohol dehydrogenase class IV
VISRFHYPSKVVLEAGGIDRVIREAPRPSRRLLVVSGQASMKRAGVLDRVTELCRDAGIECTHWAGVTTNPTDSEVDVVADFCRSEGCDGVLGLGGGSSLDTAKLVAMMATNGGKAWDYVNMPERRGRPISERSLPLSLVPTTSGTASESTPYAVVTHHQTRLKKGVGHPRLYPDLVVLDPALLALMPPAVVAMTGFDCFGQALEGYTSKHSSFHSDYFGFSALQYIVANLEPSWCRRDDLTVKANMAWGAFLSGLSIGLVDVNLAHAMSHPISSHFGMHHGLAVLLCTFQSIQFNRIAVPERYARVAELFGVSSGLSTEAKVDGLIGRLQQWTQTFCIDLALSHYGLSEADIPVLVADAIQIGAIKTNPREVGEPDLEALYCKILEGRID